MSETRTGEPPAAPPDRRRLTDHPLAAIAFVLLAIIIFSTQDTLSKILVADYSPLQIAWLRYAMNVILLIPFLARSRGRALATHRPLLQVGRGAAVVASSVLFMAGLERLPIADTTAINFIAPFVVTALAIPVLGEKVGLRRWLAVAAGFAGAVIIIRPGTSAFDPGAVFPLLSATCWALALVATRRIKSDDTALTTIAYSTLVPVLALTPCLPFVWQSLTTRAIAIVLVIGVISLAGQYFMILGYMRRPASALAPLTYTQMIWSTIAGVIVFGTVPGWNTWIGGAIVVASGLYVLHRERLARGLGG